MDNTALIPKFHFFVLPPRLNFTFVPPGGLCNCVKVHLARELPTDNTSEEALRARVLHQAQGTHHLLQPQIELMKAQEQLFPACFKKGSCSLESQHLPALQPRQLAALASH